MHGILLLNKPLGISSNFALTIAKKVAGIKKAGHTGSLDPLASGMLPICFGEATKFSRYLLDADKCYQVIARLGETTETGDSEGVVLEKKDTVEITHEKVAHAAQHFTGDVQQVPPMYSALKHKGQPLYKLARRGEEVQRQPRSVSIYAIELISFQPGHDGALAEFSVECSKGTYIRTLVEDMGNFLGCGAHVQALHRNWVKAFQGHPMVDLDTFREQPQLKQRLLPIENALVGLPDYKVSHTEAEYLIHGRMINVGQKTNIGMVKLKNPDNQFIGMGQIVSGGRLTPKRMMSNEFRASAL